MCAVQPRMRAICVCMTCAAYLIKNGLIPAILMIQPVRYPVQQIKRSQGGPYVEKSRVEHKDAH